jgi:aminotransferase
MAVNVTTGTSGGTRLRSALSDRATRIRGGRESPFFQLLRLADERDDVIRLGRGEPDIATPGHIVEAAKRALDDGHTTYTNPAGLPELREAIANKLQKENGLTYDPASEIIVTTGAQEALAIVMQTLLDAGDEVILASPFYMAYEANIVLAGGTPVFVPTRHEEDFQLRAPAVEERITARTKLLALVSPNNPTASVLKHETVEELAEVARRYDLPVLWDELYEKVVYDDFEPLNIASLDEMRDRTIVVNGFSKAYSMTGLRVGYMAGPADYIQAALEPRHSLTISAPTPFQYAALAALSGPQDFLEEMMSEYTARRNMMKQVFDDLGVGYSLPKGGFYFFADIKATGLDSLSFCKRGVVDHGVLFFPGSMFGEEGEGYIRISFLAPRSQLEDALARFADLYRSLVGP